MTLAFSGCATGEKRKKLAVRFTQYLSSRNTKDNSFVVNLNGVWGSGKTYFITEWKKLVQEKQHIAINIDAWESDYLNDPLTIIIAEILEQIKAQIAPSKYDPSYKNAEKNVASALISVGKSTIPLGIKVLGKHLLGEAATDDILNILEKASGSLISRPKKQNDLNMGELGLEAARQHTRHKQFTKEFKQQVQDLVDLALNEHQSKQVYVFIDELDRCRPTYAIEMLETVKHLFDIPNFIFVLSTDTSQLQHSIKAVYGNEFDSYEYLSRFFEQRLSLPEPNFFEFLTAEKTFESQDFQALKTLPTIDNAEQLRAAVALVCEQNKHQLTLRRVKQITAQLETIIQSEELKDRTYPILTLIGLVIGRALYSGLKKPIDPFSQARQALSDDLKNQERIFNSLPVLINQTKAKIHFHTVIDICAKNLNQLDVQSNQMEISRYNSGVFETKNEIFKLLIPNFPLTLINSISKISNLGPSGGIIADQKKLFSIIESLNLYNDTSEDQENTDI